MPLSEFGVVVGVVTVTVVAVAAAAVTAVLVAAAARTSSVGGCLAATEPAIQHPTHTKNTRGRFVRDSMQRAILVGNDLWDAFFGALFVILVREETNWNSVQLLRESAST